MSEPLPDVMDESVLSELSLRGLEIYRERLQAVLEPQFNGQVVAVHLDTGEYAVANNSMEARRRLRRTLPQGIVMTMDIGPVDEEDSLTLRMLGRQVFTGRRK